jgi:nucleoside-diphosphate-sugar epimerase
VEWSGKKVAITGGAGLIGSFLAEDLARRSAQVVVVDDFSTGLRRHLAEFEQQVEVREGNLEDPSFARTALADAQVVFHLASRAYGVGFMAGRHLDICLHNERVTNSVIAALATTRPEFVLAVSSSCVHRDDGPDTFAEMPVFDGEPEAVNRGYGWAKRFLEQKCHILAEEQGIPVAIARPVNIYGERYRWRGNHSQAIPMLVHKVMSGSDRIVVWGSGRQRRNYLHAQDCAALLRQLVEAGTRRTVNVGFEETVSIGELAHAICEAAGRRPEIVFDTTKPEGRFIKSADATLLQSLVANSKPSVDLRTGLARMIDWYHRLDPEELANSGA